MAAENTLQVFEWLWSSGQLSADDIVKLPALGVEVVINLALPTSSNVLDGEADLVTGQGLNYIHIPVQWEKPNPEQFFEFAMVLQDFSGRIIWVHCAKNMRVSTFIYLFRKLVLGESEEVASFPMQSIWNPNETWQSLIRQMCEMHLIHHSSGTPNSAPELKR